MRFSPLQLRAIKQSLPGRQGTDRNPSCFGVRQALPLSGDPFWGGEAVFRSGAPIDFFPGRQITGLGADSGNRPGELMSRYDMTSSLTPFGWVVGYHDNSVGVTPAAQMRMSTSSGPGWG